MDIDYLIEQLESARELHGNIIVTIRDCFGDLEAITELETYQIGREVRLLLKV